MKENSRRSRGGTRQRASAPRHNELGALKLMLVERFSSVQDEATLVSRQGCTPPMPRKLWMLIGLRAGPIASCQCCKI